HASGERKFLANRIANLVDQGKYVEGFGHRFGI
ncbi:uncharacterized protein METZ01_LOCUS284378, partial [marine metagenome]